MNRKDRTLKLLRDGREAWCDHKGNIFVRDGVLLPDERWRFGATAAPADRDGTMVDGGERPSEAG